MYELSRDDYKDVLDLVTSLVNVKSVGAFSEMLINSKEQIGFESLTMVELVFGKTVTHKLIYTEKDCFKPLDNYTIPSDIYDKDPVYPQILAGKEVVKTPHLPEFLEDIIAKGGGRVDMDKETYCMHILSKLNKETMTANVISFRFSDREKSVKFDAMAGYLHIHLMSAFVRIMGAIDASSERLSDRELSVLTWLKHGKTSWEVAKILNITENTVNFHIKNIKRKLNATNRQHAVAIAIAKAMIE